jgi:outer membrane protein assembly factor BamB
MRSMRGGRWVAGLVLVLLVAACQPDYPTHSYGVERQAHNPTENQISTSNVAGLRHKWSVDLGAYINASPILATGITINGTARDVVYVGTEHGVLYAVSTSGQVLWSRNLGTHVANCPDTPDNTYGVSASAVYDRAGNNIYVVGGAGYVYALDPATGATKSGWPVQITTDPSHEAVYSAPTLFGNQLYVETASHCDAIPYRGRVVGINTSTRAKTIFWVNGATGPYGGGIWGWGGASVDPANGDVYVATGNAIADPENYGYSNHVVRLSSALAVKASHAPGDLIRDDDFGSTPVLFQKSGCPPQLAVLQKNGSLYLYDRDRIATGFRQRTPMFPSGTQWAIGQVAYSPVTQMVYVANQADGGFFTYGIVAFRLDANCNLALAWQTTAGVNHRITSSPTVANGVVYYGSGSDRRLYAFNAQTGQKLWTSAATDVAGTIVAAPVAARGQVYAGAYDNRLHAWGL